MAVTLAVTYAYMQSLMSITSGIFSPWGRGLCPFSFNPHPQFIPPYPSPHPQFIPPHPHLTLTSPHAHLNLTPHPHRSPSSSASGLFSQCAFASAGVMHMLSLDPAELAQHPALVHRSGATHTHHHHHHHHAYTRTHTCIYTLTHTLLC